MLGLFSSSSLFNVDLSFNALGPDTMSNLLLGKNGISSTKLSHLNLSGNNFGDEACASFFRYLSNDRGENSLLNSSKECISVEEKEKRSDDIEGGKTDSERRKKSRRLFLLSVLEFSHNQMGYLAAEACGDYIASKYGRHLAVLNLAHNALKNKGAAFILKAIEVL